MDKNSLEKKIERLFRFIVKKNRVSKDYEKKEDMLYYLQRIYKDKYGNYHIIK